MSSESSINELSNSSAIGLCWTEETPIRKLYRGIHKLSTFCLPFLTICFSGEFEKVVISLHTFDTEYINTPYNMSHSKNNMTALLFIFAMLITGNSIAADLVVQESGPVGTYTSIGAAVAASTDGDRIIINNTVSGFPWTEDIVINKTLTFLSAADNQRFVVQGDYTIQHAPGREVTIIGMDPVSYTHLTLPTIE